MKTRLLFFIVLILLTCSLKNSCAQQIVLAAGGEATGSTGMVSYSVGQIDYITLTGAGGTVTEGIQQPYEILFNGLNDPRLNLECIAYPNPATTFVRLKIENREIKNLSYRIYSLNGMIVKENLIQEKETIIPMDELMAGTYLLTVSENEIAVNSYKIIKK